MTKIKMVPAQSQDEPSITVFTDEHGNVVGNAYTMSKDEVQYHLAITKIFSWLLVIGLVLSCVFLYTFEHYPGFWTPIFDKADQTFQKGKYAPDYVKPSDWTKRAPTEVDANGRFCVTHMCEGGYATKADYDAAHPEVAQQAADYDAQLLARRQAKAQAEADAETQQKAQ